MNGIRVNGFDPHAKGFSESELRDAYYRLIADSRLEPLLFESISLDAVDETYNPGEPVEDAAIYEAVRVQQFHRDFVDAPIGCRTFG